MRVMLSQASQIYTRNVPCLLRERISFSFNFVLNFPIACKHPYSTYADHYCTLGLKPNADQESVRKAFITLCKKYHPDSGSPEANPEKFNEIEKAYRCLQSMFINQRWNLEKTLDDEEDSKNYDIKHTAPQHRHYLSWSGVGSGTPSQRQQQYVQQKAAQAQQRVIEHRMQGLERTGDALSVNDRRRVNKIKTRFGMERLVEDMIQESIARGEFDNLSGAGKPLQTQSYNPHLDFVTQKMNEIMIENGFTPEWITLGREIQDETIAIRKIILENIHLKNDSKKWETIVSSLNKLVEALNKKIQLFNLIVPILNRQRFLLRLDEEVNKISKLAPNSKKPVETRNIEEREVSPSIVYDLFSMFSIFKGRSS